MSQTLSRGLETLVALGDGPKTISDIAEQLDVHHSTALRLLHTLEEERFVVRRDGRFHLGPRVAWLGQVVLDQSDLRTVARPFLEELCRQTGETIHLGALLDTEVVYIDKVESTHPVRMYSQIGRPAPLHCTGVAKAIAANNPGVRRLLNDLDQPYQRFTAHTRTTFAELQNDFSMSYEVGYLLDDREHEESIHCIAAAIRSANGISTSAISVAVPVHRCDRDRLLSFAPDLMKAAAGVSVELGYFPEKPIASALPAAKG